MEKEVDVDLITEPSDLYVYVFIVWVILWFSAFIFVKLRYPFWNLQPVYHTYDRPWAWFRKTPYIVYTKGHESNITKFYSPHRVNTIPYGDMSENEIDEWMNFLRCYAIPSDRVLWTPTKEQWHNVMSNTPLSSMVSLYRNEFGTLHGCTHSVPYKINLYGEKYSIMYQDMVCKHRDVNDRRILYNLLETHWVHAFKMNSDWTPITLLKKEGNLDSCDGMVPLVTYTNYVLNLGAFRVKRGLPGELQCIIMDPVSMDTFFEQSPFLVKVYPDMYGMIRTGEMYAYCLRQGEDVLAFFSRHPCAI